MTTIAIRLKSGRISLWKLTGFACSTLAPLAFNGGTKKTKIVKSPKQLRLTENKFMKCTRVRGENNNLYLSILFQKKTLCKGKLMISLNFSENPGRSDELNLSKKNHSSQYRMGRSKADKLPLFLERFLRTSSCPGRKSLPLQRE